MTVRLHPVPLDFVNQTWPAVAGYLAPALALCESGEALYNLDHVRQYVVSGEWELFVALTEDNQIIGAGTVSYSNYPLHRVAFITTVGGKGIINKDTYFDLLTYLKLQRGVTLVQAFGRKSINRLLQRYDFKPRNTLVELTL